MKWHSFHGEYCFSAKYGGFKSPWGQIPHCTCHCFCCTACNVTPRIQKGLDTSLLLTIFSLFPKYCDLVWFLFQGFIWFYSPENRRCSSSKKYTFPFYVISLKTWPMAGKFQIKYVDTPPSRKWNIAPKCGWCIETSSNEYSLEREEITL